MLASPRTLARKPFLFAGLLLVCGFVVAAGFYELARHSGDVRQRQLVKGDEETAAERQARKLAACQARRGDSRPLCDDSRPTTESNQVRWEAWVDCLAERRRDPAVQLEAVDEALRRFPDDQFRMRRAQLLSELGEDAAALAQWRLLYRRASDEGRAKVGRELARAILFGGHEDWADRSAEAREVLGSIGGPDCDTGALRVIAAWPDPDRIATASQSYGDCADRTSSGSLATLMEIIAVGAVSAGVENAPDVVSSGPAEIAQNFEIKSIFAMCAESVPDAPGLRERCESVLTK